MIMCISKFMGDWIIIVCAACTSRHPFSGGSRNNCYYYIYIIITSRLIFVVLIHREPASTRFRGTIVDLETIGEFDRSYMKWDPRQYAGIRPTIFGYISWGELVQYCAEGESDLPEIEKVMNADIPFLDGPFYALNANFERCIIENSCGLQTNFIDVRGRIRGSKWGIRRRLGIPSYGDPFRGEGSRCVVEWLRGNYGDCLRHNRACLLIERDIHEFSLGI
jgi:hypothetical protein